MLTDITIRKIKPADTDLKLRDGRGLYLLIALRAGGDGIIAVLSPASAIRCRCEAPRKI